MEEKKIVTWALIVLFLSLTMVYSLVYMKKTEVFTSSPPSQREVVEQVEPFTPSDVTTYIKEEKKEEKSDATDVLIVDMRNGGTTIGTAETEGTAGTVSTTQSGVPTGNTQSLGTNRENPNGAVHASTEPLRLLSGTTQFFGMLDVVEILGISPEYTLQDERGNFFAYYGTKGLDFVRTVQQLGGNVYVMATENEILKNELFGDKVSFINLMVFKDKLVLMVIELDGKTWLLQVPADKYHHSKVYLKSLFIS